MNEFGKHWKASGLLRAGTILMSAGKAAEAASNFAAADRLFEESFDVQTWLLAEQERHAVAARGPPLPIPVPELRTGLPAAV